MKILFSCLILLTIFIVTEAQVKPLAGVEKNRMIILADMGNEPDEEQQNFHLLMYSNEFDIEGLVAKTYCCEVRI